MVLGTFAPRPERSLDVLAGPHDLSRQEIARGTDAGREVGARDRSGAWVRVHRALADADPASDVVQHGA